MRRWIGAVTALGVIAVAVVAVQALPDRPAARGDFKPFVMTIEQWDSARVGLSDGRKLAGTSVYRLVYDSRENWTLTLVSDDVPGWSYVQAPGQGNACRDGKYGHIDASGTLRITATDPNACEGGMHRWIHHGIAWGYSWDKRIEGDLVTYTSPGELVVFDLKTGLPVLYEAGRIDGQVGHRTVFRVEPGASIVRPRVRPASLVPERC